MSSQDWRKEMLSKLSAPEPQTAFSEVSSGSSCSSGETTGVDARTYIQRLLDCTGVTKTTNDALNSFADTTSQAFEKVGENLVSKVDDALSKNQAKLDSTLSPFAKLAQTMSDFVSKRMAPDQLLATGFDASVFILSLVSYCETGSKAALLAALMPAAKVACITFGLDSSFIHAIAGKLYAVFEGLYNFACSKMPTVMSGAETGLGIAQAFLSPVVDALESITALVNVPEYSRQERNLLITGFNQRCTAFRNLTQIVTYFFEAGSFALHFIMDRFFPDQAYVSTADGLSTVVDALTDLVANHERLIDNRNKIDAAEATLVLVKKCEQLRTELSKDAAACRVYAPLMRRATELMATMTPHISLAQGLIEETQPRCEPVFFSMVGRPGIGKSHCIARLSEKFCTKALGWTADDFNPLQDIYQSPIGSLYDDTYRGQPVYYFDDFMQIKDAEMANASLQKLISFAGTVPVGLNSAEVSKKGKLFFRSALVAVTANVDPCQLVKGHMSSPEALARRFEFQLTAVKESNDKHEIPVDYYDTVANCVKPEYIAEDKYRLFTVKYRGKELVKEDGDTYFSIDEIVERMAMHFVGKQADNALIQFKPKPFRPAHPQVHAATLDFKTHSESINAYFGKNAIAYQKGFIGKCQVATFFAHFPDVRDQVICFKKHICGLSCTEEFKEGSMIRSYGTFVTSSEGKEFVIVRYGEGEEADARFKKALEDLAKEDVFRGNSSVGVYLLEDRDLVLTGKKSGPNMLYDFCVRVLQRTAEAARKLVRIVTGATVNALSWSFGTVTNCVRKTTGEFIDWIEKFKPSLESLVSFFKTALAMIGTFGLASIAVEKIQDWRNPVQASFRGNPKPSGNQQAAKYIGEHDYDLGATTRFGNIGIRDAGVGTYEEFEEQLDNIIQSGVITAAAKAELLKAFEKMPTAIQSEVLMASSGANHTKMRKSIRRMENPKPLSSAAEKSKTLTGDWADRTMAIPPNPLMDDRAKMARQSMPQVMAFRYDTLADRLSTITESCGVRISILRGDKLLSTTNGFGIGGRYILTTEHLFGNASSYPDEAKHKFLPWGGYDCDYSKQREEFQQYSDHRVLPQHLHEGNLVLRLEMRGRPTFEVKKFSLLRTSDPAAWNSDAIIVYVPEIPQFRYIVKSFITDAKMASVRTGPLEPGLVAVPYDFRRGLSALRGSTGLSYRRSAMDVQGAKGEILTFDNVWETMGFMEAGECGSLLGSPDTTLGDCPLLGILSVGDPTTGVYWYTPVTREMLEECIAYGEAEHLEKMVKMELPALLAFHQEPTKPMYNVDRLTQLNIIGQVNPRLVARMPEETRIRKSKLFDATKARTAPARIRRRRNPDGSIHFPQDTRLTKQFAHAPIRFDKEDVNDVSELMLDMVCNRDLKGKWLVRWRALSERDNVAGLDELVKINTATSPGLPWCAGVGLFEGRRQGGKRDFFVEQDGQYVAYRPEFREICNALNEKLLEESPAVLFNMFVKDERLPLAKIDNPRTIAGAPVEFVMVFRSLFGAFLSHLTLNRDTLPIAVGVNPGSPEWHMLAKRLHSVSGKARFVAFDHSSFDKKLSYQLTEKMIEVINGWYDHAFTFDMALLADCQLEDDFFEGVEYAALRLEHEQNQIRRRNAWASLTHTLYCNSGVVFETCYGNPSGNPATVQENSLVNIAYVMLIFKEIVGHFPSPSEVQILVYGDDVVLAVSDAERLDNFNFRNIQQRFAAHGLVITNPQKDSNVYTFYDSIEEVDFLKRAFVLSRVDGCGELVYLSALDKQVIFETMMWYHDGLDESVALEQSFIQMIMECVPHGQAFFDSFIRFVRPVMRGLIGGFTAPSWSQVSKRYWDHYSTNTMPIQYGFADIQTAEDLTAPDLYDKNFVRSLAEHSQTYLDYWSKFEEDHYDRSLVRAFEELIDDEDNPEDLPIAVSTFVKLSKSLERFREQNDEC